MYIYTNQEKLDRIFSQFSNILNEYEITKPEEVFKVLNMYQLTRLNDIENANNEKHRVALGRTVLYHNSDVVDQYNKTKSIKKKELLLNKIVNLFVLDIPEPKYINVSGVSTHMFNIIANNKSNILNSKDWYLRIIPESKWLIEYLETKGE